MTIDKYWPEIDEINECIKTEAESAHESLLLAVHQPLPLLKRSTTTGRQSKKATEEDLLNAFLSNDLPEGTLVMPITGPSGMGKSHMIRWLFAQLQRMDADANKLHIIRIPKSASLRSVVDLILAPLKGIQFDELKHAFSKATAKVTPENAVIQFRAGLQIALKDFEAKYTQILKDAAPEDRAVIAASIHHAKNLPHLLNDGSLTEYYGTKVLGKIIERAVVGRNVMDDDSKESKEHMQLPQFQHADLELPESIDVSEAARPVRHYYLSSITNQNKREGAVEVLNSVLDEAIRNAFNLGNQLGGMTLQDIILEIRKQLLGEQKELVLLIEDFAALSGIQEILLNICIQEAIRDGQQDLCTMRTAIAVTDGYLTGRDTILTRSQFEWVIDSTLLEQGAMYALLTDLVGAYLNVSRHGHIRIKEMFEQSYSDDHNNLTDWITPFNIDDMDSESNDTLSAFGISSQQYPLFPFTKTVVKSLADKYLMDGSQLSFNPRLAIKYIIRGTLLQRDQYEKNNFPPPEFNDATVSISIEPYLNTLNLPPIDIERYRSLICYWGGRPTDLNGIHVINSKIFDVFNLKQLTGLPSAKPPSGTKPPEPRDNKEVRKWEEKLQKWAGGVEMPQTDANEIRKVIAKAVTSYINWNLYSIKKQSIDYKWIDIPNARGNPQSSTKVRLAETRESHNRVLGMSLLALIRYNANGKKWNYEGSETDSIHYAQFIENISKEVIRLVRHNAYLELVPISQALFAGSHILGLSPASNNKQKRLGTILMQTTQAPLYGLNEKWDDLSKACYESRNQLLSALLARCGCFQGDGNTPFAIDLYAIKKIIDDIEFYGNIDFNILGKDVISDDATKAIFRMTRRSALTLITTSMLTDLRKWYHNMDNAFGADVDKNALLNLMNEIVSTLSKQGKAWPINIDESPQVVKGKIKRFRETAYKDTFDNVAKLVDTPDDKLPELISVIAKVDPNVIAGSGEFVNYFDNFLEATETRLNGMVNGLMQNDPGPVIHEIKTQFINLEKQVKTLKEVTQ